MFCLVNSTGLRQISARRGAFGGGVGGGGVGADFLKIQNALGHNNEKPKTKYSLTKLVTFYNAAQVQCSDTSQNFQNVQQVKRISPIAYKCG